ncbi:hypothetical protein EUB48_19860 [Rhodoferax sediminis]|uniref:Tc1-like transposase DDE domain-containing protein n=1 Tax=Rhodoferax sediminis TaxID=2509614 RepID=A0A515DG02_9BURK|nr:hypothetical protein EUB48_19860 [Rhodoferax sediminis]
MHAKLHDKPVNATHWSTRTPSEHLGLGGHDHPRFVMHFTPTSASWLNMVERFFRDITDKRIKRDSITSVTELELATDLYVAHPNIDPKPFIWTASAKNILAKVSRVKGTLAITAG